MVSQQRILVVGGGITGMAAAIALAQNGHAVDLIEEDSDWKALGAGLTVLGSTLRALSHLGIVEEVLAQGYFAFGNDIYHASGRKLFEREGMQMPDCSLPNAGGILRPVLHRILQARVRDLGIEVALGLTYRDFFHDDEGVNFTFSDGSSEQYDFAVVAEGLNSRMRGVLFPDAPKPTFTGQGCWRLLHPRPDTIPRSAFYVGGHVTVGTVPVSDAEMYVWVLEHVPDNPWIAPEDQPTRLRSLIADFGGEVGNLRDSIGPESSIVYRPLEALLLPAPWHSGRILMMGDSVHATSPHLASGAGAGVEDGVVLAEELERADSIPVLFDAFMARRFDRCRLVVEGSIEIGEAEMAGESSRINELMTKAQAALAMPF
uniref:FAD-dependent oxidoreductase n=1 Tax=Sphingomonas populi TaxID=2484750 RepID=UPI001E3B7EF1|nr:FAD-dependent oxidoreductase [Sphingomonas populi]